MGNVFKGLNEIDPCGKLPYLPRLSSHFKYISLLVLDPRI